MNQQQGQWQARLIDTRGEQRLVSVVRSYRGATVGQTAEKANAGSDKKSVRIQLFILLFAVLAAKGGPM